MKYILVVCLFITIVIPTFGQNGILQGGARSAGMAYTAATIDDSWSVYNNPGGLGRLQGITALFAFENKYNVEGFNTMMAGVEASLPPGNIGLSVFKFGDNLYNEQTASFIYANSFGIASLGLRANYIQYHLEGYGNKGVVTIDFGGIAKITDLLFFGAYVRNINQAKLADLEDEHVPTLLNAGLSFRPSKKIMVNIEAEKDIDFQASAKAGLEYVFLKKFTARTGVKSNPLTNFFGLGFNTTHLQVDYALTYDQVLGYSHQAAVSYQLRRKK